MTDKDYIGQDVQFGLAPMIYRVSAAIVAFLSMRVGLVVFDVKMTEAYQALLIITFLLALILFPGSQAPRTHESPKFLNLAISIIGSWIVLLFVLLLLGYMTKSSALFSRKLLFTWAIVTPPMILAVRLLLESIVVRIGRNRSGFRKAVIAGVNGHGRMLADRITNNRGMGLTLVGCFDDRGAERLGSEIPAQLLGRLSDLPDYVRKNKIDLIYIALPIRNIVRVTELLDELHDTTASIYYLPDVFAFDLIQCRTAEVDGLPVVALCETPFYGSRGFIKRISDFSIAVSILVLILPVLLTIAIAVKATTPGSVIFKQRRYGLDGKEITIYKFRTMTVSEDSDVVRQATKNDQRVTKVGSILRKYSLDELPQFINVVQGRMSIVGPRPHAVAHNEEYRRLIKGYMIRHKVKPGVTGLAQVRGFRGETATVDDMRRRVEADLEYLRNWSFELDVRIILKTALMIFKDGKAY